MVCLGNIAQTDVSEVVGNEELPAGLTLLLTGFPWVPHAALCCLVPISAVIYSWWFSAVVENKQAEGAQDQEPRQSRSDCY